MTNVVVAPKNIAKPTQAEIADVYRSTASERVWYANWYRYRNDEDVRRGIGARVLYHVPEDANGKPVQRLESIKPEHQKYWCYLGRGALAALRFIGAEWRKELEKQTIDPNNELRLAYTSLLRTVERQREIVADGVLAVDESTHEVGQAFDTDASSYYRRLPTGRYQSIPHPDRPPKLVVAIGDGLRPSNQIEDTTPEPRPDLYDPRVTDALLTVGSRLAETGLINHVIEFAGTANQCVHAAPNLQANFADRLRIDA